MFMCTNTQMPNNKSHFCCSLMRYTQFGGRKEQWNDGERERYSRVILHWHKNNGPRCASVGAGWEDVINRNL